MDAMREKFEKLRDFLSKLTTGFCVVYRANPTETGPEMRWCAATSPYNLTHEEHDKLAARYHEVALGCYQDGQNLVMRETLPSADSRCQRWRGLLIHTKGKPPPANSRGQRWWQLVVASGATRDAGYAIVARVAAKDAKEVEACIAEIQDIMSANGK